jgi:hypothetical protein
MTAARWDELAQQLQSLGVIPDSSGAGAFEDLFAAPAAAASQAR